MQYGQNEALRVTSCIDIQGLKVDEPNFAQENKKKKKFQGMYQIESHVLQRC